MIRFPNKLTRGNKSQHDKVYIQQPIAKIVVIEGIMKAFHLKSGMRLRNPFSPLTFNVVLEILAKIIRQVKEIKEIQAGKAEV